MTVNMGYMVYQVFIPTCLPHVPSLQHPGRPSFQVLVWTSSTSRQSVFDPSPSKKQKVFLIILGCQVVKILSIVLNHVKSIWVISILNHSNLKTIYTSKFLLESWYSTRFPKLFWSSNMSFLIQFSKKNIKFLSSYQSHQLAFFSSCFPFFPRCFLFGILPGFYGLVVGDLRWRSPVDGPSDLQIVQVFVREGHEAHRGDPGISSILPQGTDDTYIVCISYNILYVYIYMYIYTCRYVDM